MSLLEPAEIRAFWRFWTARTTGHSAALFRVSYGLLSIWTTLFLFPNVERFYSNTGMFPWKFAKDFPEQVISVIALAPESDGLIYAMVWALLIASLAMTVGYRARLAAIVIFVVHLTFQHRNPYTVNAGDRLFLIIALLSSFMPLAKQWSVEAWQRSKAGTTAQENTTSPIWAQRLIALQLSYVYLYAFGAKILSPVWQNGTALYGVMASTRLAEWPTEIHFAPLVALMTWGTIIFELALPLLAWRKKYRAKILIVGVLFHLGIEVTLRIPLFSAIMVVCYASYLTDEESRALVARVGRLLKLRIATSAR
jgi:hypothetical protein